MKKILSSELFKIILAIILLGLAYFLNNSFSIVFYLLSFLLVAWDLFKNSYNNILEHVWFDENTLMLVATIGAFFIREYPEAIMVVLLYNLGEYLSDKAIDHSKESITKLMDLTSDEVRLLINDEEVMISTQDAKVGDVFVVRAGEKIPLDGVIIKGEASLDTSSLTGESIPRFVQKNDFVLSGSICLDKVIIVKASKCLEDSTASKILNLLENSTEKKAKTEKMITRFAKVYTPIIVIIAVIIFVISLILGVTLHDAIYMTCVFLVMSCPCALVLSVPLSYFCGIGRASKEGILIKGAIELERLKDVNTIALDKTGTLTEGVLIVEKIVCNNISEEEILKLASLGEYHSNHPIAKSILKKYGKSVDESLISNFEEISGKGVRFLIDKEQYLVGNDELLNENGVVFEKAYEVGTIVYVACNKACLGYLVISAPIKKDAGSVIKRLQKIGIQNFVILSGDTLKVVEKIAKEVNVSNYYAELLPIDKVKKVEELKKSNVVAFVGDGMNDAPVIKVADIGIAMGDIGSDATIEASDIVFMKDDLKNLEIAIQISKWTNRLIKINICFALMVKAVVLILNLFQIGSIWLAVFADVGVTLLCVLHTLTIMRRKF